MAFPVVEALLVEPAEGKEGKIAICTNTLAPGMVSNEIAFEHRSDIAALGSLIVNRDGAERMIINCLSHPTLEYLILFGQETASFCPSTNLLCALMNGYAKDKQGNFILGGKGVGHNYPSIPIHVLELFKKRFKVIPLFGGKAKEVVQKYVEWLEPHVPEVVFSCIKKIIEKKEVYYDSLVELIQIIAKLPKSGIAVTALDPKDFQHLQPPIIQVVEQIEQIEVPFEVKEEKGKIAVTINASEKYTIAGTDSFLMAYSIMKEFQKNKIALEPVHELLLGAEMSRVEMQIKSGVASKPLVLSKIKEGQGKEISLSQGTILKADKKYYYKIGLKNQQISVQSLAHETCTPVFEFRGKSTIAMLKLLAKENRFEEYEQTFLHRLDVGIEVGRAGIALLLGYSYFQDFRNLFKLNTTDFPYLFAEGDSFLAVHQRIITALYTRGLTAPHADAHKGTMRDACILAAYRDAKNSLNHIPEIYASGSQTAHDMRVQYKEQLISSENDGAYTYGQRTRAHFGCDQLIRAVELFKENPKRTVIIQRFDFNDDMGLKETSIIDAKGNAKIKLEGTKDPCLTHDIYFIANNKLQCFHTARAHNIVNAYAENIFGLHDAYDSYIAKELGIELGDMFMLSSRGNMLLLTEEQKAKSLIAEPSKPIEELDTSMGPFDLQNGTPAQGIGVYQTQLVEQEIAPIHPDCEKLENYNGVNLVEKAANYLKRRGETHNNAVIGTYDPKKESGGRLVFFQCNPRGGKLCVTAVFIDGAKETVRKDVELCNYVATRYKKIMGVPLGELMLFYAPIRGET